MGNRTLKGSDPFRGVRGFWLFEVGSPMLKGIFCSRQGRIVRVEKIAAEALSGDADAPVKPFVEKIVGPQEAGQPARVFISRSMATLRNLELPSTDAEELAAMVDLQIGKHSPYSSEEIVSDWRAGGNGRPGFSPVLLAVVHREFLTGYLDAMRDLNLSIGEVGLVSSGLPFFAPKSGQPGTILLDLDTHHTEFQIVSGPGEAPQLIFSRPIPVGEARLAENQEEGFEKLITEIKRSIEIVRQERLVETPPGKVLITGATRHLKPFMERLQAEPGMSCQAAPELDQLFKFSPAAKAEWQAKKEDVSFYGLLGSLSPAAAFRLDLMPPQLKMLKGLEQRTREIMRLGVLVSCFAFMVSGLLFGKIFQKNLVLERLNERYEKTAGPAGEVERMQGVLDFVRRRAAPGNSALEFLAAVQQATPQELYYTHLAFEENKSISLKGYAKTTSAVFDFVARLEKTEPFRNIETKYATRKKIKEEEMVEFEIVGRFGDKG